MDINLKIDGTEKSIHIEKDGENFKIVIDNSETTVQWVPVGEHCCILSVENKNLPVYMFTNNNTRFINIGGENYQVEAVKRLKKADISGIESTISEDENFIAAPMPERSLKFLLVKETR